VCSSPVPGHESHVEDLEEVEYILGSTSLREDNLLLGHLHEDGRAHQHHEADDLHELHTVAHSTTELSCWRGLLLNGGFFRLFDLKRYNRFRLINLTNFLALALSLNCVTLGALDRAVSLSVLHALLNLKLPDSVGLISVSDPCIGNHGHQRIADNHCSSKLKNDQNPVKDLTAEDASGADFTELNSRESVSMVRPVEVLLHGEEHKQHLEGEGRAGTTIKPAGDDSCEAVELQEKAEVDHRAGLARHNDSSLQDKHTRLNRELLSGIAHDDGFEDGQSDVSEDGEVNSSAELSQVVLVLRHCVDLGL